MNNGGPHVKTHASEVVLPTNSSNNASDTMPRLPVHVSFGSARICVTLSLKHIVKYPTWLRDISKILQETNSERETIGWYSLPSGNFLQLLHVEQTFFVFVEVE